MRYQVTMFVRSKETNAITNVMGSMTFDTMEETLKYIKKADKEVSRKYWSFDYYICETNEEPKE